MLNRFIKMLQANGSPEEVAKREQIANEKRMTQVAQDYFKCKVDVQSVRGPGIAMKEYDHVGELKFMPDDPLYRKASAMDVMHARLYRVRAQQCVDLYNEAQEIEEKLVKRQR